MARDDPTTRPDLESWVDGANRPDCDFPIQNLPYGIFTTEVLEAPRACVAIGDKVLDLSLLEGSGLIQTGAPDPVFLAPALNDFMALGPESWQRVREALSALLSGDDPALRDNAALIQSALVPMGAVTLHRPFRVAGFTDFYASREHATNVGRIFRGEDAALMPNWLHMPVAYNGRAGTVVVSGTGIRRPRGQLVPEGGDAPVFAASEKLDFELELGAVVGVPGVPGEALTVDEAEAMIFGYVLLNDWSARDIQQWEYQPLGPFLGKAFATTISPWMVTPAALRPFRIEGPAQDPEPLPYLRQTGPGNYDIELEVSLTPAGGAPATVTRTNFKGMYWSTAQQLAHHASGGCAMQTGDLLGSGTVSGRTRSSRGSLLELTWNGRAPLELEGGGTRTFLEDGDTVTITGRAGGRGRRIGFGLCAGIVLSALSTDRSHHP